MPKITTQISNDIYKKIENDVKAGLFQTVSEAINVAIRKTYARKSREYLKWIVKKEKVTELSMLDELKTIRR